MILLDTNSYTAFLKKDAQVKKEIDRSKKVLISVISAGELLFGFKKGSKEESNLSDLKDFLRNKRVKLLPITFKTAVFYATIKNYLAKKGQPIPANDIWIAASCAETKSTLITFDKHFIKMPGLKVWKGLTRK